MDITDDFDHLAPPNDEDKPSQLTSDALAAHDGPTEQKPDKDADDASDSDLSEIDDNLFKDYNAALPINNRPVVPIDEEAVAKLGVHRRQRDPNEVANDRPVTKKMRRDKRRNRDDDDEDELGGGRGRIGGRTVGGRRKKGGDGAERVERPARILNPEEQRMADLDAKIGEALRSKTKRRKKKDEVVRFPHTYLPPPSQS